MVHIILSEDHLIKRGHEIRRILVNGDLQLGLIYQAHVTARICFLNTERGTGHRSQFKVELIGTVPFTPAELLAYRDLYSSTQQLMVINVVVYIHPIYRIRSLIRIDIISCNGYSSVGIHHHIPCGWL